ncbi:MAG: hypothetical protein RR060_02065, partial [Victivallaceae bacterium]
GIFVTRWMYQYLGRDYYGFWALLWAIFVYVLVLDFGFSKAAQKATAERLFERDLAHYNRVVSAVFSMQWSMSLLIVLLTLLGVWLLPEFTQLSNPGEISYCRMVLLIFGAGIALTFPTGMFPEILIGMKLIYLRNYALVAGRIIELVGILILFRQGGSLLALVIFTVVLNFSLNMVMWFDIWRNMPGFRLKLTADITTLKELLHFSIFSYLASIANLIASRTDRIVLGVWGGGVTDVGIYQLGTRLPDIAGQMTSQYQDNVAPYTAELCQQQRFDELRHIILRGIKFTVFLAAGGVGLGVVAAPEILHLWFGKIDPLVIEICRWMLIYTFFWSTIRTFSTKMMLMSGYHKRYCILCWVEAVSNITLSMILLFKIGLMGLVYGNVISLGVLSVGVYLPFCAMLIRYKLTTLYFRYYLLPIVYALAAVAAAYGIKRLLGGHSEVVRVLGMAVGGGVIYLSCCWWLLFAGGERKQLLRQIPLLKKLVRE